jgi:hypothetical protein
MKDSDFTFKRVTQNPPQPFSRSGPVLLPIEQGPDQDYPDRPEDGGDDKQLAPLITAGPLLGLVEAMAFFRQPFLFRYLVFFVVHMYLVIPLLGPRHVSGDGSGK